MGYSLFKKEITPFLPEWFEGTLELAWSKKNDRVSLTISVIYGDDILADHQGGHFAALEQPELLWENLQDFLKTAWKH